MFSPLTYTYAVRIGTVITIGLLLVAATGISENFSFLRHSMFVMFSAIAILFVLLRNKGVALGCAVAALIFNPYWYPSLSREIWVILDILAIGALGYATYWATDSYKKGSRFEEYVMSLFAEPDFILQDRTRDLSKKSKRFVESDTHPDFVFRSASSGQVFAIECKWRSKWAKQINGGTGLWWNLEQSYRYENYQQKNNVPVYIAIGIGGTPSKPKEVYFLELGSLRFPFLFKSLVQSGKSPEAITHLLA